MHRSTALALCVVVCCTAAAQASQPDEPPRLPCPHQPQSLAALKKDFASAKLPSPKEMTGTWIGISVLAAAPAPGKEFVRLNCQGIRGEFAFEKILFADGYSVRPDMIGQLDGGTERYLTLDETHSLAFPISFGGEGNPVYRCRLTKRDTLVCLVDEYYEGGEFRRIAPLPNETAIERLWLDPNWVSPPPKFPTREEDKLLLEVGTRALKDGSWAGVLDERGFPPRCVGLLSWDDGEQTVSPWLLSRLRRYAPQLVACPANDPDVHQVLLLGPVNWLTPSKWANVSFGNQIHPWGRETYSARRGFLGRWTFTLQIEA